ncbi:MAG: J domain-containing protein [Ignavibacteria bacterium]|nr:J domain-containing protein [Ignavibacteria bacterium]MBL7993308.1 J domain-containing protein [Candidatus Kapabacteria bacterium]
MGQLWDRLRRVGESYINDFSREDPDYSKLDPKILEELRRKANTPGASRSTSHRGYETEEERLKRLINEAANPQEAQQQSSSSQQQSSPPPKHGGMGLEEALRVLGLPANASVDDMKREYKKLMMQYHPDRVSHLDQNAQNQARVKAQRINEAYQVIKVLKGI